MLLRTPPSTCRQTVCGRLHTGREPSFYIKSFENRAMELLGVFAVLVTLLVNGCHSHSTACRVRPVQLSADLLKNPVVQTQAPRLSWELEATVSGGEGLFQKAFRIQCGSASNSSDFWDSGWVASNQTLGVKFGSVGNAPLRWPGSMEVVHWSVSVSESENPSIECASVEKAHFEVGLLEHSDWGGAEWIGRGLEAANITDCMLYRPPYSRSPLYRKSFPLSRGSEVVRVRLYLAVLGYAEAYANGVRLGQGQLGSFNSVGKRQYYQVHDATAAVRAGGLTSRKKSSVLEAVEVGLWLGNGFFNPLPLRFWGSIDIRASLRVGVEPLFKALLVVQYKGGNTVTSATRGGVEGGWRTAPSAIGFNNVYLGELFNASAYRSNWATAAFEDSAWAPALQAPKPPVPRTSTLAALSTPPITETLLASSLPADWQPQQPRPLRVRISQAKRPAGLNHFPSYMLSATAGQAHAAEVFPHKAAAAQGGGTGQPNGTDGAALPAMPEEADGPNVFMLLDVGQNFAGRLELNVTGPAGAVVHLTYGELLSLDGSLNPMTSVAGQIKSGNGGPCAPRVAVQTDLLLLGAEGTVRGWRGPRFGWHGFRYALVNATAGVHITGVRAWGMRSAVASAWHFNSSSAVLNGASAMAQNTLDANLMGTQSDCPHRERFGYGGDLLGTSKGGMALHDMRAMYSARLQDFVDATDPLQTGGGVPETAPYVGISSNGVVPHAGPVGWGSVLPILSRDMVFEYGMQELAGQHLAPALQYVQLLQQHLGASGTVENGLSDWMAVEASPVALTGLSFAVRALLAVADLALLQGQGQLAEELGANATALIQALNAQFLTQSGAYADPHGGWNGTQCSQALPLYHNWVPASRLDKARDVLIGNVLAKQHQETGLFCTGPLYAVLSRLRPDLAVQIATQVTYPSYGFMLQNNATTIWESWFFSNNTYSHNHFMFGGGLVQFLKEGLGGILNQPDRNLKQFAYSKVLIEPQPDPLLTWSEVVYNSARGPIHSNWTLSALSPLVSSGAERPAGCEQGEQGHAGCRLFSFQLSVRVPPNCNATVVLPKQAVRLLPAGQGEYLRYSPTPLGARTFRIAGGGIKAYKTVLLF